MTFHTWITEYDLDQDPFELFQKWFAEAASKASKYPEAMTLATSTADGYPSARVVLFKGLNPRGLCFFTNYESRKSHELINNPRAALVFYWPALDRQIRIEGTVEKVSKEESDDYWESRPRESRISALTSSQSQKVPNREALEKRYHELTHRYEGQPIPRPEHWGGFCLVPKRFEFWVEGAHRLHDRFCYERNGDSWTITRLSP